MIKARTPYRLSFFGGGSDYVEYYLQHSGAVLSTTIDKYCYISLGELPPLYDHTIRVVYSKVEECNSVDEIEHTIVKAVLRYLNSDGNLSIVHDKDLPARSGLGSSSAFAVGLLHAIFEIGGHEVSKFHLARMAFFVERELAGESVGFQDQVAAAYGGLNKIRFTQNGEIAVESVLCAEDFQSYLMLFHTGTQRFASEIAKSYEFNPDVLEKMVGMVEHGKMCLQSGNFIKFGELMHEAWTEKKKLSDKISNPYLDDLYERARKKGAVGGKVIGAGGGGFLLLFVVPEEQDDVRAELKECVHVPFKFEDGGSQIIYNDKTWHRPCGVVSCKDFMY